MAIGVVTTLLSNQKLLDILTSGLLALSLASMLFQRLVELIIYNIIIIHQVSSVLTCNSQSFHPSGEEKKGKNECQMMRGRKGIIILHCSQHCCTVTLTPINDTLMRMNPHSHTNTPLKPLSQYHSTQLYLNGKHLD